MSPPLQGRRILITGATGLVGRPTAEALAADGCEIVALSRDPGRAFETVPGLAGAWSWSGDGAIPKEATAGLHAVVHLAGESVAGRWTAAKKRAIETSRIEGTRRLVDAIEARPPSSRPAVLISASAMGLYGDTGEREAPESERAGDDFLARLCVDWEREAMRAEDLGVRVVSLRIALVLARRGGALAQMLTPFRLGLGGPLGSGRQWWSWIHVADLVGLIRHALATKTLRGPVNACAPTPVRQAEFAATLGAVLGRPARLPVPAIAIRAVLGEFAGELLASRRLVPARAIESGYEFRFRDLEAALRDLLARPA